MTATRFHISKKGGAAPCRASIHCPLGGEDAHGMFESQEAAQAWAETKLNEEYGGLLAGIALSKREQAYERLEALLDNRDVEKGRSLDREYSKARRTAQRWTAAVDAMQSLRGIPKSLKDNLRRTFKSRASVEGEGLSNYMAAANRAAEAHANYVSSYYSQFYTNPHGRREKIGTEAVNMMADYESALKDEADFLSGAIHDDSIPESERDSWNEARAEEARWEAEEIKAELKAKHNLDPDELRSRKMTSEAPASYEADRARVAALQEAYRKASREADEAARRSSDARRRRGGSISRLISDDMNDSRKYRAAYHEYSQARDAYDEKYLGKYAKAERFSF